MADAIQGMEERIRQLENATRHTLSVVRRIGFEDDDTEL